MSAQFRITVWPGACETTEPLGAAIEPIERDDGTLLGFECVEAQRPTQPFPDEFVLRELLDLEPADYSDAWRQYGILVPPGNDVGRLLPPSEVPHTGLVDAHRSVVRSSPRTRRGDTSAGHRIVSLYAIDYYMRTARALSRQWIAYKLDQPPSALLDAWESEGFTRPRSRTDAWRRWAAHMSAGLTPFHVRVQTPYDWPDEPPLTVYSVALLQLSNLIADELDLHQCANETCSTTFARQLGRAQHAQHRSVGVQYCTDRCARAQNQRKYRRRQKERTRDGRQP
jgi:hypothetical protein